MMLELGYSNKKDEEKDRKDLEEYASKLEKIGDYMLLLNEIGQNEAVRRIQELTEIPKYRTRESPSAYLTNEYNNLGEGE